MAINSLRVGHSYVIRNLGELVHFRVLEILADGDVRVKHIHTLEEFLLSEITRWGKGKDYYLSEI